MKAAQRKRGVWGWGPAVSHFFVFFLFLNKMVRMLQLVYSAVISSDF